MVERRLESIDPEPERSPNGVFPSEPTAAEIQGLVPLADQKLRWDVRWGEILSADPEQLRSLLANMNEQIRRLYELRTMEIDLRRPLTSEEVDLTLHREKAGREEDIEQPDD